MIKVEESYADTNYDIYFKSDKDWKKYVGMDDALIHFQSGSDNLQDAIKICDELNSEYVGRRSAKGEKTNGVFVVCSDDGDIVYDGNKKTVTESKSSLKRILTFDDDFDSSWTVFEIDPSKVDAEKFAVCALGMDADDDEYQNHNYADIIDDYNIRIVSASDYDDFDYDVDKIVKFFDVDEVYYGKDLYNKYKEFN